MPILLFDIDGTLVRTGGAGKAAMERALREGFGIPELKDVVPYGGRTDKAISRDLLQVHQLDASPPHVERLTKMYLERLPDELNRLGGAICPGISELIRDLNETSSCVLGLLTGNVRAGARLKLGYFDLWDYFRFGGFGDHHHDRDDVAREALEEARRHAGPVDPADVWVIGDTPLDVSCARAIGAKSVAVATGWVSLDDLKACQPDFAFADLSEIGSLRGEWIS